MVGIEGMKMPGNCISCPFIKAEGTKFFCSRIMKYIDKNDLERKRDDCPLVDIVITTCKSPIEDIKLVKEEIKECSYSLRCFNEDVFDEDEIVVDLNDVLPILDKLIKEVEE